ncbi:DNA cytosine methyltransferase [Oleiharenicola sp. Vm1]|uniref:DNA cytosine methyltransferase n=1 Tax=Oleiharenicola sp. Vm1 TaxID=3398393 RepID=UPI0039F58A67
MPRPIGIDLFAGVGGMSLGFEQAGFDVVAAVEYDPVHAAAHEFNFPSCATIARSVVHLSGAQIREAAGIGGERVDVVFGGPPCQGFSLIGQRALDDPRNGLVRDYVRIVRELEANYFVFENVKGLTLGEQRKFLEEIIAEFRSIGYNVRLPWRVLNAAHYGVPQDRERLILIGARRGLPLPEYPMAKTIPAGSDLELRGLQHGPSCEDALEDLPDAETFETLNERDWVATGRWGSPSAYAAEMRCLEPESWHFGIPRVWDASILTSSARSEHTEISRRRFAETPSGRVEPISRLFKLPRFGLANTLRAGSDSQRGAFTSPRPIHYRFNRCVTVREMARLHGFPDWFRFHVTKWHGARQIGNAVPPPLARAIAAEIVLASGAAPRRQTTALALGDPNLLAMEMSEAAAHFGVPVPIGSRDRKSGARKRKQIDIERERTPKLLYA